MIHPKRVQRSDASFNQRGKCGRSVVNEREWKRVDDDNDDDDDDDDAENKRKRE